MAKKKYDWERWFGYKRTTLVRGIDYHCSQSTMVQTIRNNASQRRLHIRINDREQAIDIEVRDEIPHTDPTAIPV